MLFLEEMPPFRAFRAMFRHFVRLGMRLKRQRRRGRVYQQKNGGSERCEDYFHRIFTL